MKKVRNIDDLIERCGGLTAFGKALYPHCDQPDRNAGMIRLRQRIPIRKWDATIRHARRLGIEVTRDQLAAWSQRSAERL